MDSLSSYSIACSLSPATLEYLLISMWKVCQRIKVNAQFDAVVYIKALLTISYTARIIAGRNDGVRLAIVFQFSGVGYRGLGMSHHFPGRAMEQWDERVHNQLRVLELA